MYQYSNPYRPLYKEPFKGTSLLIMKALLVSQQGAMGLIGRTVEALKAEVVLSIGRALAAVCLAVSG